MLNRLVIKRGGKQEGESPFWISFSDLMSALMVLFLVVMAVTLVAVTKSVTAEEVAKIQRENDIRAIRAMLRSESKPFPGVKLYDSENTTRIDLHDLVRFASAGFTIKADDAHFLRRYVPAVLRVQATREGQLWIRNVVVKGFTDPDGTYLYNLGLSLNRSRSVVCVLFASPSSNEMPLIDEQKKQIRDLFLVGGLSFNDMRSTKEESRRVELEVTFLGVGENRPPQSATEEKEFGQC